MKMDIDIVLNITLLKSAPTRAFFTFFEKKGADLHLRSKN